MSILSNTIQKRSHLSMRFPFTLWFFKTSQNRYCIIINDHIYQRHTNIQTLYDYYSDVEKMFIWLNIWLLENTVYSKNLCKPIVLVLVCSSLIVTDCILPYHSTIRLWYWGKLHFCLMYNDCRPSPATRFSSCLIMNSHSSTQGP